MKKLYNKCGLVHSDLSEYNMLWFKDQVWVIDVSQAVDNTHPKALEFLHRDCSIVTKVCIWIFMYCITCIQRPQVMKVVSYSRWSLNSGSIKLI